MKIDHRVFALTGDIPTSGNQSIIWKACGQSLVTSLDQLRSSEGESIDLRQFKVTGSMQSRLPFSVSWYIVQTIGTVTPGVYATSSKVNDLLDSAISDDFGFFCIQKSKHARFIGYYYDGSVTNGMYGYEYTITLPKNIINILKKTQSTERMQILYLVCVIQMGSYSGSLNITGAHSTWIEYIQTAKDIIIR